jgi:glucuronokinase
MIIRTQSHARAGLIGNPSDGYHGRTISFIVRNFTATAVLRPSDRLVIVPARSDVMSFDAIDDLRSQVTTYGYYGGVRLVKAAIKRFTDYCEMHKIELPRRNFTVEYDTNVPVRVGLAGSSAIVTAVMRALMQFHDVTIPEPILPELILSVERDELGIGAGLQDRVIQVYEGAVFMDFDRAYMEEHGHGRYESLDPARLPPLFIAYHDSLAEGTEVTHNDLRDRFDRGDPEVHDAMAQFASYAAEARDLIVAGRGGEIGPLMDANFDLRARLCSISPGNRRLVEIGRSLGAAVKFAGSGGAVVGCYDGDPDRYDRLVEAYEAFGASVLRPMVVPTGEA